MAHKLLDGLTALGASDLIRIPRNCKEITLRADFEHGDADYLVAGVTAATVKWQGGRNRDEEETGVVSSPTIAIGSTDTNWKTATFTYRINGTNYTKATVAAGAAFTANHVVNLDTWGVIFLYIDAAGTQFSYINAATQTTAQAYASHALAMAVTKPAGTITGPNKLYIGKIIIEADGSSWTANTDNLTKASELEAVGFYSEITPYNDIVTHTFSASEITARTATWHVSGQGVTFGRLFLSTLTGTASSFDGWAVEFKLN